MVQITRPLNPNLPMVDEEGLPTPFFMRWIQEQADTNTLIIDLTDAEAVSGVLDVLGADWGEIIYRGETLWTTLPPGSINQVLKSNGPDDNPSWDAFTFTELDDSPANYVGFGDFLVKVTAAEDGLEFVAASSVGATTFTGLTDTPSGYAGETQKLAWVNAGETAIEFATISAILDVEVSNTRGSILYRGLAGWEALGPDSSTTPGFLQSGGPGADPVWATPAGGGGTPSFSFRGFYANLEGGSTQGLSAATLADFIATQEQRDTNNGYDPVTGIYTVPAALDGTTMVFTTGIEVGNKENDFLILINYSPAVGVGNNIALFDVTSASRGTVSSPPILVSTGDAFKVQVRTATSSTISADARCFFSGHVVGE